MSLKKTKHTKSKQQNKQSTESQKRDFDHSRVLDLSSKNKHRCTRVEKDNQYLLQKYTALDGFNSIAFP